MSLQNIKFQSENPFSFKQYAQDAAAMEAKGLWAEAHEMWITARKVAKKPENLHWAQVRADYCLTAKFRHWGAAA